MRRAYGTRVFYDTRASAIVIDIMIETCVTTVVVFTTLTYMQLLFVESEFVATARTCTTMITYVYLRYKEPW